MAIAVVHVYLAAGHVEWTHIWEAPALYSARMCSPRWHHAERQSHYDELLCNSGVENSDRVSVPGQIPVATAFSQKQKKYPKSWNPQRLGNVQFWTDTISAQPYLFAMKLLNVIPALIVVFVVAVLSLKRGMIFVP